MEQEAVRSPEAFKLNQVIETLTDALQDPALTTWFDKGGDIRTLTDQSNVNSKTVITFIANIFRYNGQIFFRLPYSNGENSYSPNYERFLLNTAGELVNESGAKLEESLSFQKYVQEGKITPNKIEKMIDYVRSVEPFASLESSKQSEIQTNYIAVRDMALTAAVVPRLTHWSGNWITDRENQISEMETYINADSTFLAKVKPELSKIDEVIFNWGGNPSYEVVKLENAIIDAKAVLLNLRANLLFELGPPLFSEKQSKEPIEKLFVGIGQLEIDAIKLNFPDRFAKFEQEIANSTT